MDEELVELQRQFEFAQQAKSSIRLSDRNVVELVQKLQELKIIDFELLHTVSGKEYITPEKLRSEMVDEIKRLGRVSVIDIADTVGVDLYHVEKQAQIIVAEDSGLMMVQGEIISQSYWDTVAEEINDRLQECSQIALAELAAQLQVGSELMASVLEPRLGTHGIVDSGMWLVLERWCVELLERSQFRQIYLQCGATYSNFCKKQRWQVGVAVEGVFFQSLFNRILKEGEILGSLRAGTHWTPTVFAIAQKECVDSFFSQNSFISYDALHKLAIPQPAQYLQTRYPEGIPLVTLFVHPSMIEMLNAAADDAIEHGTWFDALSVLPTSFGLQDASKILSLCQSVNTALKSNKALTFGESYIFSDIFIKDLFTRLEKEMETISFSGSAVDDHTLVKEAKGGHDPGRSTMMENANENGNKLGNEKVSKKKKGKSAANAKNSAAEVSLDNQDSVSTKSKRNQKKGKESQAPESKGGPKSLVDKAKEQNIPSEEWVMEKIMKMVPDFEEQGSTACSAVLPPTEKLGHTAQEWTLVQKKKRKDKQSGKGISQDISKMDNHACNTLGAAKEKDNFVDSTLTCQMHKPSNDGPWVKEGPTLMKKMTLSETFECGAPVQLQLSSQGNGTKYAFPPLTFLRRTRDMDTAINKNCTPGMEDPESTLRPVASYLRPKLHNAWKDKRKALFTENSDKIRRVIDNLQKKLDEPFLNIQLYEKALDLFEEDPPTSVILHKHLLRTIAASIVEVLLVDLDKHNKLKNGIEVEETSDLEIAPLGPGDRISIAKGLPGSLSTKALTVVETLEGKRVEAFTTAMRDVAEECGLSLKKLDKKLERTLLHSYRKDLTSQVSAEADPVPLLPKVVSLLYVQVYSRALQAPGRAINACITRLEDKLDASSYKILLDYHRATVTLLALMSASVGDEEDCTSDRTLTKRELLESLMPSLKSLVLNPKPTAKT
ncbi:unnamed protein product [Rhodiola kirilowii]